MTNQDIFTTLQTAMQDELSILTQLLAVLEQEQEALEQKAIDTLEKITDNKTLLLKKLEQCNQQRGQILLSSGFTTDKHGLQDAVDQAPSSSNLTHLWQEIAHVLRECHKINEINGRVITISRNNTHRVLEILCGNNTPTKLYQADGSLTQQGIHINKPA